MTKVLLICEPDLDIREYVELALSRQGYQLETALNCQDALAALRAQGADTSAIVIDLSIGEPARQEILRQVRLQCGGIPMITISSAAPPWTPHDAPVDALQALGAPLNPLDLRRALKAALHAQNSQAIASFTEGAPAYYGWSPAIAELRCILRQVSWSEAPVLVRGETGSGKEVFARELHFYSRRAARPMLKINCAALPSELVESELFGYERGAFTGAFQRSAGMFERADGGTVLLDEIGDMDVRLQAKLLQVLQDQSFHRLGGRDMVKVDVRVIAATHRDLERAILDNAFREDLYYRLNVISLQVPPLRERREDIPELVRFLLRKHAGSMQAPEPPRALLEAFQNYHWPGNVRELENLIRKYLVLGDADLVCRELKARTAASAPATSGRLQPPLPPASPQEANAATSAAVIPISNTCRRQPNAESVLQQVERQKLEAERAAIHSALAIAKWNRRRAASMLQIDYKALLYRMKRLGIQKEAQKAQSATAGTAGAESA